MAEEDIYFARLDQELIEALHQKKKEQEAESAAESRKVRHLIN
ncbi:MAG: hypothetical protein ABFS39_17265 [Pseudomonadota bacterium]